ncbi:glycosyltransferase family 4 protein [Desulfoferrobacter suflitae]|uniref:glycosyltransferase family 4 protein n=1 Tax=Desulfoferrobacter suflitae TaxID=2865782 RepID=UPI00216498A3|nr:MraY family glycosyltransferase [Desulfoferrobacter suflitae]MCK8603908.1 undecaprenyl/decaprenyl-phosphate alpha-N-acetylglucosaminyl 1-phosphate transferase [Desulfoferrobacter suflitae]
MTILLNLFVSVVLTTVLVPPFMKVGRRVGMVDVPDARKVHSGIIPRTGGLAILVGALIPLVFLLPLSRLVCGVLLGGGMLLVLGIVDDSRDLDHRWKFLGQVVAAVAALAVSGLRFHSLGELWPGVDFRCGSFGFPLAVFFLVATTNLINLADGLDGLAGGICLLIFFSSGALAFFNRDLQTLVLCVCMTGAIIGFLRYNAHPAVVFLGDTGSMFLGFMVGYTMLSLSQQETAYHPVLILYLIGVPVIDTMTVMLQRLAERRPLFEPDKRHLHHKLLKLGLKHHQAVIAIYGTQLALIILGLTLSPYEDYLVAAAYVAVIGACVAFLFFYGRIIRERPGPAGAPSEHSAGLYIVALRNGAARIMSFGLLAGLWIFYLAAPVWIRPVPEDIGVYSIIFAAALLLARFVKHGLLEITTRVAAYFAGVYYIVTLELGTNPMMWAPAQGRLLTYLFAVIALFYCGYLVISYEKMPIVTMDYLLLSAVALVFFFPSDFIREYHVHRIALMIMLMFLAFELVLYKLRNRMDVLIGGMLTSLGLNFAMAFWPWII